MRVSAIRCGSVHGHDVVVVVVGAISMRKVKITEK
jgi:hypothetical protein